MGRRRTRITVPRDAPWITVRRQRQKPKPRPRRRRSAPTPLPRLGEIPNLRPTFVLVAAILVATAPDVAVALAVLAIAFLALKRMGR